MEMARVVLEAIAGGEVHAAAEPPGRRRGEEAHVHVHRRAIRIARVQHERHPHRVVRLAGELRPRRRRRDRKSTRLNSSHSQISYAVFCLKKKKKKKKIHINIKKRRQKVNDRKTISSYRIVLIEVSKLYGRVWIEAM